MAGPVQEPERPRGCFFYGCITALVLLALVVVGLLVALGILRGIRNRFTDTKPVPLPTVAVTAAQLAQLRHRVAEFEDSVRLHRPTPPLTLTGDELDALLQSSPEASAFKNQIYVSIQGDKLKGQVSIPLDRGGQGFPFLHGRYLNGTGTFSISLHDGVLNVHMQDLEVNGQPLPSAFMERIRGQNLARDAANNPRTVLALDQIKQIDIKDGKVVVVPKPENEK